MQGDPHATDLVACLEHFFDNPHEGPILERSRDSLSIRKLLVDLVILAMSASLDPHLYAKVWGERLFEPHTNPQPDRRGKRTVGDGWRYLDKYSDKGVAVRQRRRRGDMNIW